MTRRLILFLFLLTALVVLPARAADWKSFQPAEDAGTTSIMIGDKELKYGHFTRDEPLTFSIEGPTRVKILTRVRMPYHTESVDYAVSVTRDGVHVETHEKTAGPIEGGFYIGFNNMCPGVIRRIYIDVPTGTHGYELRATGAYSVDARLFERAESKPSRVSLAPSEYESVETLFYRDKELTYYVLTKDVPVLLDVVGPTSIKVNTRLLYDATMLGEQTYVVGVRESGSSATADGAESLYKIDAEPSETVVCRDRSDVIPGALRHFMLDVPTGAHTYEFRLVDTVAGGLAIKFYIPRGDLLNEP